MKSWPFHLKSYKDVLTHIIEFDILPGAFIWGISSFSKMVCNSGEGELRIFK